MKVTEEQIAERYAAMTNGELEALDPRRLTPEAARLRVAELERRGLPVTPTGEEARARRDEDRNIKKDHTRQLTAVALVTAALLTEFAAARFIDIPGPVSTAAVVVLCLLALYVLRRRR